MICTRNMSKDPAYSACPDCGHSGLLHPLLSIASGAAALAECQVCLVLDAVIRMEALSEGRES